ncbi:CotO family spore coat protein [Oceanobacillus alkalisoli]|uniref:CotO family spore coat protein n=1 Tax=Oceanobacillus alkalisoli TaxID=2925113 RepID=UPI001EF12E06|nr:CotO family spore coat protein [Oceanobacillus alkalisoli]MCF3942091.1 spore coat CotO family protein [Oceanobacillus alkalisoli]MCG5105049.1 spore coat CotO family protein [Oceanobacillus alkalisoli]
MDKERYAKAPLLYIHQARTEKINANMQEYYRSSKMKAAEKKEKPSNPGRIKRTVPIYNHNSVSDESETDDTEREKDKNFQDMTVEEQLIYLADKPSYAPRLICEIRTTERSYKGIVLDYKDGAATIRSGRRSLQLPYETIERIRLLSL